MNTLHLASIFIFIMLIVISGKKFLDVRDNDLGYEEVILLTASIISGINGVASVVALTTNLPEIVNYLMISSQLFLSLLIFSVVEFISSTQQHRLENKRKNNNVTS